MSDRWLGTRHHLQNDVKLTLFNVPTTTLFEDILIFAHNAILSWRGREIFFTKFHPKHSLRHENCKGLLKFILKKSRNKRKTRETGLGHQATGISKTYSLASWKNLSYTGLGSKKMEADSTNDLCEQENSVSDLECECVQCWHDSMSMDWLCE